MSKTKSNELKFSIRNLIDTTSTSEKEQQSNGVRHPPTNRSLKRLVNECQTPLIRRPIPILTPKVPHPCWSFLSQLATKNPAMPLNSPLAFLTKMGQVWEQIQRAQISPSIPTENDDVSDEENSSVQQDIEIDDDDDDEEEEDVDDEEEEEHECSSNGGDKLNPSMNSEENEKLKTYPCTHCGKVKHLISEKIFLSIFSLFESRFSQHSII